MVSSTVAPTAAAAVSAAAVAAIASSVGSAAAAALCLLAEWRLCASAIGCAMAVLLHSHLLAHTLYSERRTAATAPPPAVPHSATAVSSHNYSAAAIVSLLG